MVLAGLVLAVGVHPIDDAVAADARAGRVSALVAGARAAQLAPAALPLSLFGLALGVGASLRRWVAARLARGRAPRCADRGGLLAVLNLPALLHGRQYVDPACSTADRGRPPPGSRPPTRSDAATGDARVLQLPGAEFGAYRWGYTVDPVLPGITGRAI